MASASSSSHHVSGAALSQLIATHAAECRSIDALTARFEKRLTDAMAAAVARKQKKPVDSIDVDGGGGGEEWRPIKSSIARLRRELRSRHSTLSDVATALTAANHTDHANANANVRRRMYDAIALQLLEAAGLEVVDTTTVVGSDHKHDNTNDDIDDDDEDDGGNDDDAEKGVEDDDLTAERGGGRCGVAGGINFMIQTSSELYHSLTLTPHHHDCGGAEEEDGGGGGGGGGRDWLYDSVLEFALRQQMPRDSFPPLLKRVARRLIDLTTANTAAAASAAVTSNATIVIPLTEYLTPDSGTDTPAAAATGVTAANSLPPPPSGHTTAAEAAAAE